MDEPADSPAQTIPEGDSYAYSPLPDPDSFRTVEVLPGAGGDPVACNLSVHSTSPDDNDNNEAPWPDYEALSYVWGDPAPTQRIRIRDTDGDGGKTMAVTANLHAALRRLRQPDQPRTLWADGICINQADAGEKSHQVRQMGAFYARAYRVVVFLGGEADGSALVPGLVDRIHAALQQHDDGSGIPLAQRIQPHTFPLAPAPAAMPEPHDPAWRALSALFLRPWWSRTWVIQEVVRGAAVEVVCGGWALDWERFAEANRAVQHMVRPTGDGGDDDGGDHHHRRLHVLKLAEKNFVNMVVLRQSLVREPAGGVRKAADGTRRVARARVRYRPTWQLIDLLERCRHAQATDPRDYVYALLGLSVDEAEGQLQRTGTAVPNYTEPATQTFVRYAEHTVMVGGAIKLLYSAAANIGIGGSGSMPSWVPDWSVRGGPLHVLSPRDDGGVNKYYAAGSLGALPARVRVSPATGWLEVGGVVAGRVARLGAAAAEPGPADPARFKSVYHRDLDAVARGAMQLEEFLASDMRTSPPHLEYVWRTLCCDVDLHTGEEILRAARGVPVEEGGRSAMIDGFDAVRQIWPAWRAIFGSGDDGPLDGLNQEDEAILVEHIGLLQGRTSDYLMATAPLCLGRRVAVLDDGRLAQVPPASEPGDVVFVPFGSAVPFALRSFGQDGGGQPLFRLLGECYVHGVMGGELLIEGRKAEDVVLA